MDYTTLIDVPALARLIGAAHVLLVDCRFELGFPDAGRNAFLEAHIPGAVYAHLEADLSGPVGPSTGRHPLPDPARFAARLGAWGAGPETQIVAYDAANGCFAARFWWLARWVGVSRVAVLDGGLAAWSKRGGALQGSAAAPAVTAGADTRAANPASLAPTGPDRSAVVTLEELIDALAGPACRLVDARAPERYAGVVEPLDPVAGHVPKAVNHPFTRNVAADGRFRPRASLRREWLRFLAGTAPRNVIAMCGSGVTACHNLLAMEYAGLSGARLYAGSWSEWIRDPARPVARGASP
jgi:thiosulfate/3-mercaptopyruvate sulfurtransferase